MKRRGSKKLPTKSVKEGESKQYEIKSKECGLKTPLTFSRINNCGNNDELGKTADSKSEDLAAAEGMKTEISVKIETVENVTLPLRESDRKCPDKTQLKDETLEKRLYGQSSSAKRSEATQDGENNSIQKT